MAFSRHTILKDDYTDEKRVGTVEKASIVPSDDPIIKGLNFDFSKGEEKPTKPRAKPTLLKQARQRVDEAAVTRKGVRDVVPGCRPEVCGAARRV